MTEKQAREARMLRLSRDACALRAQVEQQVISCYGEVAPAHRALLDSLQETELLRLEAAEDVAEKGLRERYYNGRQSLERKNLATDIMLKAATTEARIISALSLRRRKTAPGKPAPTMGGDGPDGDDLDDY